MVYYVVILFPTVLPHSRLGRAGEKTISGSYYVLSVFYLTTATHTTAVGFLYGGGVTAAMTFSTINHPAAVGTVGQHSGGRDS